MAETTILAQSIYEDAGKTARERTSPWMLVRLYRRESDGCKFAEHIRHETREQAEATLAAGVVA